VLQRVASTSAHQCGQPEAKEEDRAFHRFDRSC
jgi:tRNA A37 threonylcarbamoyladenosine synthetase subunit TsaC/SUA5/YrdC